MTGPAPTPVEGATPAVQQGPEWLGRLAYDAPSWAGLAVAVAVVAVLGLAALGAYRNDGVDEAVAMEMLSNGLWVGCIWMAAELVTRVSPLGYAADVALAVVLGGGVAYVLDGQLPERDGDADAVEQ